MKQKRRRKKYPGIRKRGQDRYEVSYYVSGKRITETVIASNEKDAYIFKLRRLANSGRNVILDKESQEITFAQALEQYLTSTEKLLTLNTQQRSVCIYNHFLDFLKETSPEFCFVHQVSGKVAKRYKEHLLALPGKSPSGMNTDITKLRAIFKKFIEFGFIRENPFYAIEKIPNRLARPVKKHLPTDYEIRQILDYTSNDPSYREITRFLVRVGRRIEETCLYEKKDVLKDREGRPIKIKIRPEIAKNRFAEELSLDDELAEVVKEALHKNSKIRYLFTNKEKRKIAQNTYRLYLQEICTSNKLNKITPHCFRYYVCNKLLNSGVNLKDAMAITGHLDLQSFMSYIKTTEKGKQKALKFTRLALIQ